MMTTRTDLVPSDEQWNQQTHKLAPLGGDKISQGWHEYQAKVGARVSQAVNYALLTSATKLYINGVFSMYL